MGPAHSDSIGTTTSVRVCRDKKPGHYHLVVMKNSHGVAIHHLVICNGDHYAVRSGNDRTNVSGARCDFNGSDAVIKRFFIKFIQGSDWALAQRCRS